MSKKNYKKYKITCGKCESFLFHYKKYGSGNKILRCYIDQIEDLVTTKDNLHCPKCNEFIASKKVEKNNRLVFKMRTSYFHRKLL